MEGFSHECSFRFEYNGASHLIATNVCIKDTEKIETTPQPGFFGVFFMLLDLFLLSLKPKNAFTTCV